MAEGFSPAENGPAPAVRAPSDRSPNDPSPNDPSWGGPEAEAAPRPHLSLYAVEVPPAGRRQVYPVHPQLFIKLSFDLGLPAVGRRGDDMVLCFDNGGEVVFRGFVGIAETHPTLHLLPPDGSLLPGDYVADALTELGEAPALPSDDGLAARPAEPAPRPATPVQAGALAAEAPRPEMPAEALPDPTLPSPAPLGPAPTAPRPSPLGGAPEAEFPVQEILQDLEAQGVAAAPAEAAGSATDLMNQVASALPDFTVDAGVESAAPLSASELPESAAPAAADWDTDLPPAPPPVPDVWMAGPEAAAGAAPFAETADIAEPAPPATAWNHTAPPEAPGWDPDPATEAEVVGGEAAQVMVPPDDILDVETEASETGTPFSPVEPDMTFPEPVLPPQPPPEPPIEPSIELPVEPATAAVAPAPIPPAVAGPDTIAAEAFWDPPLPEAAGSAQAAVPSPEAILDPSPEAILDPSPEAISDPSPEETLDTWPEATQDPWPGDAPEPAVEAPPAAWSEVPTPHPAAEPPLTVQPEPSPEAGVEVRTEAQDETRAETRAETWTETWAETWAGVAAAGEVAVPQEPAPGPSEALLTESADLAPDLAPEPLPWPAPVPDGDFDGAETAPAAPAAAVSEASPPEVWSPAVFEDADPTEPGPILPAIEAEVPASTVPEDAPPEAGPDAGFDPFGIEAASPAEQAEATPAAELPEIAVPDFAALATQAGLELPRMEESAPMELFEGPGAAVSPPCLDQGSEALHVGPCPAADVPPDLAADVASDAPAWCPAEIQPAPVNVEPLPAAATGDLPIPDAALEDQPDPEAPEAGAPGSGSGILRNAMASVLRARNRILPSRDGEDTAAGTEGAVAPPPAEIPPVARSVLDEEEVLELTQPAEVPLPPPPLDLAPLDLPPLDLAGAQLPDAPEPESAGAPPPPLEEGKAPAEGLDAIELFSDPLSYGAGVAAPPVPEPAAPALESVAGRRLGPGDAVPAAVQDAVRLALHQMDGADLFDFGAGEEGEDGPRSLPDAPERGELSKT